MRQIVVSFVMLSQVLVAQSPFLPGYLVLNGGERHSIRLLDRDWVDNPEKFRYKTTEGTTRTGSLAEVVEFGLDDGSSRYLRAVVQVDRSSNAPGRLSNSPNPEFSTDTVFLEWLVDGEADLFRYEEGELRRYYFRLGEEAPAALVSRRYRSGQEIRQQDHFRGVLTEKLSCAPEMGSFRQLAYQRQALTRVFTDYNSCVGAEFTAPQRRQAAKPFTINLRPGVATYFGSFFRTGLFDVVQELPFANMVGPRLGVSIEVPLPGANQRWAFTGEVAYQAYRGELEPEAGHRAAANVRSITVPLGGRRYFHLRPENDVFVALAGVPQFPLHSFVVNDGRSTGYKASFNFGVEAGLGYRYRNRYEIELRYAHTQDILQRYITQRTELQAISVIAGYRL